MENKNQFTVTFAIGGAGAQVGLACAVLRTLENSLRNGRIHLIISVGTQKIVLLKILRQVNRLHLLDEIGKRLEIVFDDDPIAYFDKFNLCMRRTDVLWTKPSELVFYAGLGLPVLIAPPIGAHEELNRNWLLDVRAGIEPSGPVECCDRWLFDIRDSGQFAEAAWNGFLKVRKLGTFRIGHLIRGETTKESRFPLEW